MEKIMTVSVLLMAGIFIALLVGLVAVSRKGKSAMQEITDEAFKTRKRQIEQILEPCLPVLGQRYRGHQDLQNSSERPRDASWSSDVDYFIDEVILKILSDLEPLSRKSVVDSITKATENVNPARDMSEATPISREGFQACCAGLLISLRRKDINAIVTIHLPTLARKFRMHAHRKDDYGQPIWDGWVADVDYFIDHVILQQVSGIEPISRKEIGDYLTLAARSLCLDASEVYDEEMSPVAYESYCADLLSSNGWRDVRITPLTGDQGVDVIAISPAGETWVFQCKKYSQNVGNSAVQEVIGGMKYYRAKKGAVVTNISFTKSAKELAAAADVRLLHHSELPVLCS